MDSHCLWRICSVTRPSHSAPPNCHLPIVLTGRNNPSVQNDAQLMHKFTQFSNAFRPPVKSPRSNSLISARQVSAGPPVKERLPPPHLLNQKTHAIHRKPRGTPQKTMYVRPRSRGIENVPQALHSEERAPRWIPQPVTSASTRSCEHPSPPAPPFSSHEPATPAPHPAESPVLPVASA